VAETFDPSHLLIALLPPIASAVWFYRSDRNREPVGAVVKAFLAGVIVPFPVLLLVDLFRAFDPGLESPWALGAYAAFMFAAIPEELCKFWFLRRHIRGPHCDEPMDGVVYGAVVSLGFAALENVLYVLQHGAQTGVLRAFTAVPMHASVGALMGLALSLEKTRGPGPGRGLVPALFLPIMVHGLYDWPLMAISMADEAQRSPTELLLGLVLAFGTLAWVVMHVRSKVRGLEAAQHRGY
jgi:RsiW-degrading membrane proteinase PrsW (M82 family)